MPAGKEQYTQTNAVNAEHVEKLQKRNSMALKHLRMMCVKAFKNESCADPEGGTGGPDPPPWNLKILPKKKVISGFLGVGPPSSVAKNYHFCWTPSHENFWIRTCECLFSNINVVNVENLRNALDIATTVVKLENKGLKCTNIKMIFLPQLLLNKMALTYPTKTRTTRSAGISNLLSTISGIKHD